MRSNPARAQSKPRERTLSHCDDDHRIRRIDGDYLSLEAKLQLPQASTMARAVEASIVVETLAGRVGFDRGAAS
jgi:hypothetical protein